VTGPAPIRIDLGQVQETLLVPLWARAVEARKADPVIRDDLAVELVSRIDFDFSRFEGGRTESHQHIWPFRAFNFDAEIRRFLEQEESVAVVSIGAGLDTTFHRIDDGKLAWVNLDLPDAAALRQKLIPDSGRVTTIGKSVLDFSWMEDVADRLEGRVILFMAAGVLFYFEPQDVETLLRRLAAAYPGSHVVFDVMTRFTAWAANRTIMKDAGMQDARFRWHLNRASHLERWVDSIEVVDEYSLLSRIPVKKDWSRRFRRDIKIANFLRLYNMVHVRL
jgi:O-methyltransferase involved in polyketide biosynthesis